MEPWCMQVYVSFSQLQHIRTDKNISCKLLEIIILQWDKIFTLIANKSPVALFLARKTLPKAPLLIGFIISKSSIDVRSLDNVFIGLARILRLESSSVELSSSPVVLDGSTLSSSMCPQSNIYFSLQSLREDAKQNQNDI